jgi:hypothetical protein
LLLLHPVIFCSFYSEQQYIQVHLSFICVLCIIQLVHIREGVLIKSREMACVLHLSYSSSWKFHQHTAR